MGALRELSHGPVNPMTKNIVQAVEAYEVYADYDANAPDTAGVFTVDDGEIAKGLCDFLNQDPRKYIFVHVEGFEWAKQFKYRQVLVPLEGSDHYHYDSVADAIVALQEDYEIEN